LAFRNARKSLLGVKLQVRHLLHIPEVFGSSHGARTSSFDAAASDSLALDPAVRELDDVISVYLRKTVDRFDLTRNYEVRVITVVIASTKVIETHVCIQLVDNVELIKCACSRR